MKSEWPTATIADCAAKEHYSTQIGPFGDKIRAETYQPVGIPVLRGTNLKMGRFYDGDFVFINEKKANELKIFECRSDDVILVHKGTVGKVGILPKSLKYSRYIMGNSMMRVRCDKEKLLPHFLYYWLYSDTGQHYLNSRLSQVGVPQIQQPLTTLRDAIIPCPSIPVQEQITRILGSLDDKIELNRQMNDTLEAMARAIFQSWFVDFDPVRAKAEGRQPSGMDAETAALFPSGFEEVDGREVPKGWELGTIGKSTTVVGGSTPSTTNAIFWENGTHLFATPKDLAGLSTPILMNTEQKITDLGVDQISSKILPVGTVLLSSRAPIGYIAFTTIPVSINQGFIAIICDKDLPNYYVLSWVKGNLPLIIDRANGTTFLEISKSNFKPMEVLIPYIEVLKKFVQQVKPLYDQIENNEQQSRTLAQIRDALLPKLMSGEIKI